MKTHILVALSASLLFLQYAACAETPSHPSRVYEAEIETVANQDANDTATTVEWDHWRNKMLRAAYKNWGEKLTGEVALGPLKLGSSARPPHSFPNGTSATFTCTITRDRTIENLHITQPSGVPEFDDLVLASVRQLDGKGLLSFPKQSERTDVQQTCTFRIGKGTYHEHQFGDVEEVTK